MARAPHGLRRGLPRGARGRARETPAAASRGGVRGALIPSDDRTSVRSGMRGVAELTARGAIPRERIERIVAQDMSVRAIATEVDRSPTTVRYWLKRYGLVTTPQARATRRVVRQCVVAHCRAHGSVEHDIDSAGTMRCRRCAADAVTRWRRRAKQILVAEAGGACRLCGYDRCLAALHFHHVDPATKRFGLGGRGLARRIEDLRAEAAKCVLLCS